MKNVKIPHQSKIAGVINSFNEFVTNRTEKHFFRRYHGFGISRSVLQILRKNNIQKIILIYEKDNKKKLYRARVRDFYELGKEYKFKDDKQLVLNLGYFKKDS